MNEAGLLADLQSRLASAEREIETLRNRAAGTGTTASGQRGSPYVLSASDQMQADATRARAAEFTTRTGRRPLGGGAIASTEQSATVGLQKDVLSPPVVPPQPGQTLPVGDVGDMLYNDGSGWVVLAAPTVSSNDPVLRHDGTAPYWEEPEECP